MSRWAVGERCALDLGLEGLAGLELGKNGSKRTAERRPVENRAHWNNGQQFALAGPLSERDE